MTCRTLRCCSHAVSRISQIRINGRYECIPDETCPHAAVANYLNIPDPAPNPPMGSDLVLAQDASPSQWMHIGMCPFWDMCSSEDSLGIPTSTGFNIHSYNPDNTRGVLENGENGIVETALAIGLTESTARVPEAGSFKATIVGVSVQSHAFDYWEQVKSEVIPWISAPIPSGGGTPTPTVTPSPTPTPTSTATPTATARPTPTPRRLLHRGLSHTAASAVVLKPVIRSRHGQMYRALERWRNTGVSPS